MKCVSGRMSLTPSTLRSYFKRVASWAEQQSGRITYAEWLTFCSNNWPSTKRDTHIYTHIQTHTHTYANAHKPASPRTRPPTKPIHTHAHTCTHRHIHPHTHPHTNDYIVCLCTVPSGGKLFEYFMVTTAGYSDYRTVCGLDEDTESNAEQRQALVYRNVNTFIGWLIFHITSIGSNGRRQQFYHSFLAQYYGLSRNGIESLHRYGYICALTAFDNMRQEVLQEAIESTRYSNAHIQQNNTYITYKHSVFQYKQHTKIQIKKNTTHKTHKHTQLPITRGRSAEKFK